MKPAAVARVEVAESCLDFLVLSYAQRLHGRPELVGRRLESIGFQVGHQLVERYSKDRPRFGDHLDVIKFLCKEVWAELFKKQVDNLRTDNHGRYVLQDNTFRWLGHVSMNSAPAAGPMADRAGGPVGDPSLSGSGSAASDVVPYLFFPCGIIRGALTSLGVPCTVSSEVTALPACSFTICVKT